MGTDKHDFREETHLNSAEYYRLHQPSHDLGMSKSAVLRKGLMDFGKNGDLKESDAALLSWIASELSLSKKDALSFCINAVGADLMRNKQRTETGTLTEK